MNVPKAISTFVSVEFFFFHRASALLAAGSGHGSAHQILWRERSWEEQLARKRRNDTQTHIKNYSDLVAVRAVMACGELIQLTSVLGFRSPHHHGNHAGNGDDCYRLSALILHAMSYILGGTTRTYQKNFLNKTSFVNLFFKTFGGHIVRLFE